MDTNEHNAIPQSSDVPPIYTPLTLNDLFMSSDILDQALNFWCSNSITVDGPINFVHKSELNSIKDLRKRDGCG
jgi:hypothetical protein